MNITVFYASTRGARSCTRGIARMLTDALLEGGTLHEFTLPRDLPHFCTGCRACMEGREQQCGGYAALSPILDAMAQSELLVFCAPTYAYQVPAQLKALLDHLAYRWMVHRPDPAFFRKQAVVITTAAGGGMRPTVRTVRDSAEYWGVARTCCITQAVWDYDWRTLPESFRRKIRAKVRKTAAKVKRRAAHLTPSLRVRLRFYLYRFLHLHRKMAAADDAFWLQNDRLAGAPWRD